MRFTSRDYLTRSHRGLPAVVAVQFFAMVVFCWSVPLQAQSIDTTQIKTQIEDGEVDKVIQNLEHFLQPDQKISRDDSVFALRTLGMVQASQNNEDAAIKAFQTLFLLDPNATIRNTDASNAIIQVFLQAKNAFKKEHGGEILRPKVIVMDPLGDVIEEKYRSSLARQFIEELQKLWLFEAMGWHEIQEGCKRLGVDPNACRTEECFVKIAKQLEGDKVVLLQFEQVDPIFSLVLKYIDVATGKTESLLKRNSVNSLDSLILTGLEEMARELEKENAAWLQFSLEPPNAYLTLNDEPTGGDKKIPVMPGKHKVCASAIGFHEKCRTLEVQKNDGITHRLALEPDYSQNKEEARQTEMPETGEVSVPEESMNVELWILGGLALVGGGLLLLFSL